MAERFSQKNLRVRPSSDEEKIVTNAKKHFEKTLVEISGELVGSVAAPVSYTHLTLPTIVCV